MRRFALLLFLLVSLVLCSCVPTYAVSPIVRDVRQTPSGQILVERCMLRYDPVARSPVVDGCHVEDARTPAAPPPLQPDAP